MATSTRSFLYDVYFCIFCDFLSRAVPREVLFYAKNSNTRSASKSSCYILGNDMEVLFTMQNNQDKREDIEEDVPASEGDKRSPYFALKLTAACVLTAVVGFGSAFFLFGGRLPAPQDKPAAQNQEAPVDGVPLQKKLTKITESDTYIPQNKDKNGVCGIAINEDGRRVAVTSDGDCPTNRALYENYGYAYISLTDDFRPEGKGDVCGYAHFAKEGARIGTKDMAKLRAMTDDDLDHILVKPNGVLCPTQAELSDKITNSVGVPVRFEYNDFDANPDNYAKLMVTGEDTLTEIVSENPADVSIRKEQSGTKVKSVNGLFIPKILLTPEAKKVCDGDFSKCAFNKDEMTLINIDSGKKYETVTHNGYILPPFMMTRGAWNVCGGIFTQCDYTPDEAFPDSRGTVTNLITHQQYTSKPVSELIEDE